MLPRIVLLFAGLALLSTAYSSEIAGAYLPVNDSILQLCSPMETGNEELLSGLANGSITGFIDFSFTDSLLGFLDEYVMFSLQSSDLRALLYALYDVNLPELSSTGASGFHGVAEGVR